MAAVYRFCLQPGYALAVTTWAWPRRNWICSSSPPSPWRSFAQVRRRHEAQCNRVPFVGTVLDHMADNVHGIPMVFRDHSLLGDFPFVTGTVFLGVLPVEPNQRCTRIKDWSLNVKTDFNATPRSRSDATVVSENRPANLIVSIFFGSNGIRAGWRLLIFIAVFRVINTATAPMLRRIPAVHAWRRAQDLNVLTAPAQIYRGRIGVASLLVAILFMALIEKRSSAEYSWHPAIPSENGSGRAFYTVLRWCRC